MFLGEHQHTLDVKGRVSLPARFRSVAGEKLVVAKGLEDCLYVYPVDTYREFVGQLLAASDFDPKQRRIRRFFTANAVETEVDGAGRITLPAVMREHAGLAKEIAVVGNGSRIELWDSARWAVYNAEATASVEDDAEALAAFGLSGPGEKPAPVR